MKRRCLKILKNYQKTAKNEQQRTWLRLHTDQPQRLRCYVVIELKVVEFMPEFAGKLNFYVSAINRLLRQPEDNPTIGLLICKSKDQTKVEWAFDSIQNPMGVVTYEGIRLVDKLPSVQELQERIKLLEAQLEEREKGDTIS